MAANATALTPPPQPVEPITSSSWQGYIGSTHDALLLFEAASRGHIPKIKRRLREEERKALIRSGQVFMFEEKESGIKRWTDGLLWSPSRILQNFLVYRQIDRKPSNTSSPKGNTPPEHSVISSVHEHATMGLAGGAPNMVPNPMYQQQGANGAKNLHAPSAAHTGSSYVGPSASNSASRYSSSASSSSSASTASPATAAAIGIASGSKAGTGATHLLQGRDRSGSLDSNLDLMSPDGRRLSPAAAARRGVMATGAGSGSTPASGFPGMSRRNSDLHRTLVGSLTSSYPFVEKGLCKKTISIEVHGAHHHLISYYSLEDVYAGRLRTPSSMPEFLSLAISPVFLVKTNFRVPPQIEVGPDGIPRYRGEAEDPGGNNHLPPSFLPPADINDLSSPRAGTSRKNSRARAASAASMTQQPQMPGKLRTISSEQVQTTSDPFDRMAHDLGNAASGIFPSSTSSGSISGPGTANAAPPFSRSSSGYGRFEPYPSGVTQSYSASPTIAQDVSQMPMTYGSEHDLMPLQPHHKDFMMPASRPITSASAPDMSGSQQHQHHPQHQHQAFLDHSARFHPMPHPNPAYVMYPAGQVDSKYNDADFWPASRPPQWPHHPHEQQHLPSTSFGPGPEHFLPPGDGMENSSAINQYDRMAPMHGGLDFHPPPHQQQDASAMQGNFGYPPMNQRGNSNMAALGQPPLLMEGGRAPAVDDSHAFLTPKAEHMGSRAPEGTVDDSHAFLPAKLEHMGGRAPVGTVDDSHAFLTPKQEFQVNTRPRSSTTSQYPLDKLLLRHFEQ